MTAHHDQTQAVARVPLQAGGYNTREELIEMLRKMQATSSAFYANAVSIGCHPFIEFTGLMNEYIKCCDSALKQGIDFTNCNTHTGHPLPIPSHSLAYMGEKLECIFEGHDNITQLFDSRPLRLRLERIGDALAAAGAIQVAPGESKAEHALRFLERAWVDDKNETE